MKSEALVDVIKEGEIITVPEWQAQEEDLFVLRKHEVIVPSPPAYQKKMEAPKTASKWQSYQPEYKKNNVVKELVDNFHWEIAKVRKYKNLSRRQLAEAVGVPETVIKMLEIGELPSDDFILVNKVQSTLGINLRRDGKNYTSISKEITSPNPSALPSDVSLSYLQRRKEEQQKTKTEPKDSGSDLTGRDIEIID